MGFSLSMAPLLVLYLTLLCSIPCVLGTSPSFPSSMCGLESAWFLNNLQRQCSASIPPSPALEVDGSFLDNVLTSKQMNGYASVLFYGSWCPFSHTLRPDFDILSSLFPSIEHFAVEQSSALPSVFSRYGVHSLPSILVFNQTTRVRYHGPEGLQSIMHFYEKTTGLQPVQYIAEVEPVRLRDGNKYIMQSWNELTLKEVVKREPYLAFAVLFLCLRVVLCIFPQVLSHLKAFWTSYIPHFNLEIFGETSQLFERVLQLIDVRKIWTKLRLCKAGNFGEGAKNARVWASSLASVSLGESSSGRSLSSSWGQNI